MASFNTSCVTPGQMLGDINNFQAGDGTYINMDNIYSTVVGYKIVEKVENGLPIISVRKDKEPGVVPEIGCTVTTKVSKITPRFAIVKILCVGSKPVQGNFQGQIRTQDVRATDIDRVEIYKSFRPGDIVLAEVISLGDAKSYYLSTAKNELGVIFAKSVAGATMIPISWEQMQCPVTKVKEFRKVAKVV